MTLLDAKLAYLAVETFLTELWERTKEANELGLFLGMISYVPGHGSLDPAMWFDWLARVKKLQTGELVPDRSGRRDALTAEMMQPLTPELAYQAMCDFMGEYWERIQRYGDLGDVVHQLRTDPSMQPAWLAAIEKVRVKYAPPHP